VSRVGGLLRARRDYQVVRLVSAAAARLLWSTCPGQPVHLRPHTCSLTCYLLELQGNLAPEFAVGKITGKEGTKFVGPARCFDQEEDMMAAVASDAPQFKGCVIVIRYEGPKGGPGMKEMLNPTAIVMGAGLGQVSMCQS